MVFDVEITSLTSVLNYAILFRYFFFKFIYCFVSWLRKYFNRGLVVLLAKSNSVTNDHGVHDTEYDLFSSVPLRSNPGWQREINYPYASVFRV